MQINIKMNKQKPPKLSPLGQLMQDTLRHDADTKYFGTRKELNQEQLAYLKDDVEFKKEVKDIKKNIKVPKLYPDKDVESFEYENYIDAESFWLRNQDKSIQDEFEKRIKSLLNSYGLPIGFYDWLQYLVLYGEPPWIPNYNLELLNDIMNNPEELQRIPLTTQEKRYVRKIAKDNLNIKGRPTKKIQQFYKSLLLAIAQSKNTKRRFRSLKTAVKTTKLGEEVSEYDSIENKKITRKITSLDLATIIFKDTTGSKSQVVRKQKQRLKDRKNLILKK